MHNSTHPISLVKVLEKGVLYDHQQLHGTQAAGEMALVSDAKKLCLESLELLIHLYDPERLALKAHEQPVLTLLIVISLVSS